MKQDDYKTDVVFRKFSDGEVIALLPHEVSDHQGNVTSYMHIGQHSSANYSHCVGKTRLATKSEYKDLKKEMEGLGYNLNVVKKQNREKYLKSYRAR